MTLKETLAALDAKATKGPAVILTQHGYALRCRGHVVVTPHGHAILTSMGAKTDGN